MRLFFSKHVVSVAVLGLAAGCSSSPAAGTDESSGADLSSDHTGKPVTLVANAAFLTDLKIDSTKLYWANNSGEVWSVPFSGGAPTQLVTTNDANEFPTLAVGDDALYLGNGKLVASVAKTGGSLTTLATPLGSVTALLLDGGNLYWATGFTDPTKVDSSLLSDVSVAGGATKNLASGLESPAYTAIDGENFFWGDIGEGAIHVMPLAGGPSKVLVSGLAGLNGLAARGGRVYWSNFTGAAGGVVGKPPPPINFGDSTVDSISAKGGATTTLVKAYSVLNVATDDSYVYWSDVHESTISRTPLAGGTTEVLVHGDFASIGPVVGATHVYYGMMLNPPQNTFEIRKVAKPAH